MQTWEGIQAKLNEAAQSGKLPAIKAPQWGTNYYIDEAGNKINKNPDVDHYFDKYGHIQKYGKPQIDWSKVQFGQNPYEVPGALLGDETILNYPETVAPTATPTSTPVSTPTSGYTGQSIGGLMSYLKEHDLPFGTQKSNFLPKGTADLIAKSGMNIDRFNKLFNGFNRFNR